MHRACQEPWGSDDQGVYDGDQVNRGGPKANDGGNRLLYEGDSWDGLKHCQARARYNRPHHFNRHAEYANCADERCNDDVYQSFWFERSEQFPRGSAYFRA